ncbi:hypothetical protein Taro_043560, partial [Colocasia esculenta]|nr:hypothetical protein [Colocasia esculenta]
LRFSRPFFVLEVFVLRRCRLGHAEAVFVLRGARRRWSFLREGPNGSALHVEDSGVESFAELSWLVWDAEDGETSQQRQGARWANETGQ